MVMKRIAAGPVDEPYVGIDGTLSVIVVALTRVQQAADEAGGRYRQPRRIGQHRQLPAPKTTAAARQARPPSQSRSRTRPPAARSGRGTPPAIPMPSKAARHVRRAEMTMRRSASCALPPRQCLIIPAGTPVIAAAQAASFGTPNSYGVDGMRRNGGDAP